MGIKVNARVIRNLQNMHEGALQAHGSAKEDGAGVSGLGPPAMH
jgi:hypothetical protein